MATPPNIRLEFKDWVSQAVEYPVEYLYGAIDPEREFPPFHPVRSVPIFGIPQNDRLAIRRHQAENWRLWARQLTPIESRSEAVNKLLKEAENEDERNCLLQEAIVHWEEIRDKFTTEGGIFRKEFDDLISKFIKRVSLTVAQAVMLGVARRATNHPGYANQSNAKIARLLSSEFGLSENTLKQGLSSTESKTPKNVEADKAAVIAYCETLPDHQEVAAHVRNP